MISQYEDGPDLPTEEEYQRATCSIKPCPFCGGEAVFNEDPHPECEGFWINCTQCKASTGTHYEHVEDMVSAWNLRNPIAVIAPLTPLVEALEMVRDADEDCKRDGLNTMPPMARAKIDAALKLAMAET